MVCLTQDLRTQYDPHLEMLQFSDLVNECKEIIVGMVKILESKVVEVVEDSKLEPKVDKPKPGSEVVAELVSPQEKIFFRPTEVEELPIETLVDLSAEPTLELVPLLAAMKVSFFLRPPDVYDILQILQIFLHEPVSQEISILVCELDVSGAKLTCHAACILLELPSTATCLSRKLAPSPPPWL